DLCLIVSSAAGLARIPLTPGKSLTLGRANECDVCIEDESVSRRHAMLRADVGGIVVEDLGSRNGTSVMGRRLEVGEQVRAGAGVVLALGSVSVLVERAPSGAAEQFLADRVVVDPQMQRLYALLDVIAPSPLHVLILGETGTGKENFAEEIHR